MSSAFIAKTCAGREDSAPISAEIARIQRHVARANRLIADLVDVASIDAGRLSIVKHEGDVHALLTEAADEFVASAKTRGVELSIEHTAGALAAEFDHARLFQVLGNLLVNAIKFSPRHGRIVLQAQRDGDDVRCSVSDAGPGIPADQIEKVFERFVQVHENDRRGLGLGLYIAKRIVDGHSGRIWAESTPGQGTRVLFTIPVRAA